MTLKSLFLEVLMLWLQPGRWGSRSRSFSNCHLYIQCLDSHGHLEAPNLPRRKQEKGLAWPYLEQTIPESTRLGSTLWSRSLCSCLTSHGSTSPSLCLCTSAVVAIHGRRIPSASGVQGKQKGGKPAVQWFSASSLKTVPRKLLSLWSLLRDAVTK